MEPRLQHFHTYFLFPFAMDRETLLGEHPVQWKNHRQLLEGVDKWIAAHQQPPGASARRFLGSWSRAAYTRFDADSPAYQDMMFFHPFVRRIFFDSVDSSAGQEEHEPLMRCYVMPVSAGAQVWLSAEDVRGRSATLEVTDIRLFLFANAMGILSIGVEAKDIPVSEALWANEMMRKVYPSSGRQRREGRIPTGVRLWAEGGGDKAILVEESYETARMAGLHPPMSKLVTSLLNFLDYEAQEYEPVLDERMIVYSCAILDPSTLLAGFADSEDYQVMLSRFVYVDRAGAQFRYEPGFTRAQMQENLYRRWAHQGTYYGFTSYSNLTVAIGITDRDEHQVSEGFLIHRMFDTRYYLMAIITLFYRATLLDFAERNALVARRLYRDHAAGKITSEALQMANELRLNFLHFSNLWYFEELANKDEEIEHSRLQSSAYRIPPMKAEIEQEIEKLNSVLDQFYQHRNTQAVNRLAMLSGFLGVGAVLTGYFGMNFGRDFAKTFFEPSPAALTVHYLVISLVSLIAFGSLAFGAYLIVGNWADYRDIMVHRILRGDGGKGPAAK